MSADPGTLGAVFADDLRQALEGRNLEPVHLLDLLAVLVRVDFVDGDGEIAHRDPAGRVADLRILP